jgi:CheY-like chemotaxis protein
MQSALILIVGSNTPLLSARNVILRSAGYRTVSLFSINEAAEKCLKGDFDLILLDSSLPAKDRDRLLSLMRTRSSHTPVLCIAPQYDREPAGFCETVEGDPVELRIGVRNAIAAAGQKHARFLVMEP